MKTAPAPVADDLDRRVRHAIYRRTIDSGRVPTSAELAAELAIGAADVDASLLRLAARRVIALAPGTTNIWMAHPFSATPTAYRVGTAAHSYWANCAWDALGIPAMLGIDSRTRAICPDCGDTLEITIENGAALSNADAVHFGVPPRRFWENVGFT